MTQKTKRIGFALLAMLALAAPRQAVAEGPSVPGIDPDEWLSEQLDEDKGVIDPPPIGDEGIHADVPNPDAGHEEEVIPPPGTPGGDPSVRPK